MNRDPPPLFIAVIGVIFDHLLGGHVRYVTLALRRQGPADFTIGGKLDIPGVISRSDAFVFLKLV